MPAEQGFRWQIAGIVLAAHAALAVWVPIEVWQLHVRGPGWAFLAALVAAAAVRWRRQLGVGADLLAAGAIGNLAAHWLLGAIPDYVILVAGGSYVAFNLADGACLAGGALIIARVCHRRGLGSRRNLGFPRRI